ncbi:hypothetical protein ACEK07_46000 [Alcanivoracaceae bacterium MT1]
MMKIDRGGQLRLLNLLADAYPKKVNGNELRREWGDGDDLVPNAQYLQEHGMVEAIFSNPMSGPIHIGGARITARGLDFLADDGGLTAILGVVTVRLEADTVRQLMESRIQDSDLPKHEKSRLLETLRSLPGEALKELTRRLVGAGIQHGPDALKWLDILTGP